jgi:hypothetical protein
LPSNFPRRAVLSGSSKVQIMKKCARWGVHHVSLGPINVAAT